MTRKFYLFIFLTLLLTFAGFSIELLAREINALLEAVKPLKTEKLEPWHLSKEEVSVPINWAREDWLEKNYNN
ncbi:hypothetical protein KGY77_07445 [Candidatus Bipolaricaulota bacterium]|nr:hypothetical protein [Candidatus Bipolaricaulota bacterium]MBS3792458.1 hypothetical protein [Candidatus Bipolaricaulota bacterium]